MEKTAALWGGSGDSQPGRRGGYSPHTACRGRLTDRCRIGADPDEARGAKGDRAGRTAARAGRARPCTPPGSSRLLAGDSAPLLSGTRHTSGARADARKRAPTPFPFACQGPTPAEKCGACPTRPPAALYEVVKLTQTRFASLEAVATGKRPLPCGHRYWGWGMVRFNSKGGSQELCKSCTRKKCLAPEVQCQNEHLYYTGRPLMARGGWGSPTQLRHMTCLEVSVPPKTASAGAPLRTEQLTP